MSKDCVVYKYEYKGEIIYIGKSDHSLMERINSHRKDEKFQCYLNNELKIYYFPLPNPAFTTIYETYLINKYQPCLNDKMKYEDILFFNIPELEWVELEEEFVYGTYTTIQRAGVYKSFPSFESKKYVPDYDTANMQLCRVIDGLKKQISDLKQSNHELVLANERLSIKAAMYHKETLRRAVDKLCDL